MNLLLMITLLITVPTFAQEELTETEKEMVEAGRQAAKENGPEASEGLKARMQAEAGIFADDEADCKFDLVGTDMLTETVVEKGAVTMDGCRKKAAAALNAGHKNFSKVIVKHKSSTKEIVIPRKK